MPGPGTSPPICLFILSAVAHSWSCLWASSWRIHTLHTALSVCLMALHCDVRTHLHVQCVRPAPHTQLLTNPHGWFSSEAVDNAGKNRGAKKHLWIISASPGPSADKPQAAGFSSFLGFSQICEKGSPVGLDGWPRYTAGDAPGRQACRKWKFHRQIISPGPLGLRKKKAGRRTEFLQPCI